jgi:hypothetical protein
MDITDIKACEQDVVMFFEILPWIAEANVLKRCMGHCLSLMWDVISRVGGSSNFEEFLSDILTLLQTVAGSKKKVPPVVVDRSEIVSDIDVQKFYSGAHAPWHMATLLSDALEQWSERMGLDKASEKKVELDDEVIRICWKYYLKEKKSVVTHEKWLSLECTYRLFLIYHKLLLRENTVDLEVGQMNAFLMKLVMLAQYTWSPHLEYKAEGSEFVKFPEFVTVVTEYFDQLCLSTDFTAELILELYEFLVKGILKKGYLSKQGHKRKNWTRRWFVLRLSNLSYFEDNCEKGCLMLNAKTRMVDVMDCNAGNHPNQFQVTDGDTGKEYCICAEDKKGKQSWILAIRKALALSKIASPVDKEEFESSLSQWHRHTYGHTRTESFSQDKEPHSLKSVKKRVKEEFVKGITQNRKSLVGTSSSKLKERKDVDQGMYVDMYSPEKAEQIQDDDNTYEPYSPGKKESPPVSPTERSHVEDEAMCTVVEDTSDKSGHSYVNYGNVTAQSDQYYSTSLPKKAVVDSGNQTPPNKNDDTAGASDDDPYENLTARYNPPPDRASTEPPQKTNAVGDDSRSFSEADRQKSKTVRVMKGLHIDLADRNNSKSPKAAPRKSRVSSERTRHTSPHPTSPIGVYITPDEIASVPEGKPSDANKSSSGFHRNLKSESEHYITVMAQKKGSR